MQFQEIGALLKAKREESGISPEEFTEQTKIPKSMILALENGDKSLLPHETYIKSYIKTYATFLGFSEEEINKLYEEIEDFNDNSSPQAVINKVAHMKSEKSALRGVKYLLVFLIIAIIGIGSYWYFFNQAQFNSVLGYFSSDNKLIEEPQILMEQQGNNDNVNNAIPENSPSSILLQPDESKPQEAENSSLSGQIEIKVDPLQITDGSEESANKTGQEISINDIAPETEFETTTTELKVDGGQEIIEEIAVLKESVEVENLSVSTQEVQTEEAENLTNEVVPENSLINWELTSKLNEGEQQAVVYVEDDCWMSVNLDGNSTYFTMPRNTQREFIYKDKLIFQFGNGSVVTLFHNKKAVSVGDSSQLRVVTLENN